MPTQAEKAEIFRALHHNAHPLVLPNAWDVPSARLFEEAGFPAVATSSAGAMVSLGYPDGEEMPRDELVAVVQRIASRLSIPLSADVVAGYGHRPKEVAETVRQVIGAGAIGINIEDGSHATGKLTPVDEQVAKLQAIRTLDKSTGVRVVLNARTDALNLTAGTATEKLDEAIDRLRAYRDAGADCLYPMGLTDADAIQKVVRTLDAAINVMVRKGLPNVHELERLGVRRISFGPSASYAAFGLLKRAADEIRQHGTFQLLTDGAISFAELNSLAVPSKGAP
jgi:2-methylisocitrate lyase-like PEP mutase family enzyme